MNPPIRVATVADAEALLAIYQPHVLDSAVSFEIEAPDSAQFAQRIARTLQRYPWLVCQADGAVLGYAYAATHRERPAYQWSVEVSAYVRSGVGRTGVGRRLYNALFEILVRQGFFNAFAGVTLPNDASVRFHEALGFHPLGVFHNIGFKHGRWHDVAWFERPLQPRHIPDGPPVPFAAIAPSLSAL